MSRRWATPSSPDSIAVARRRGRKPQPEPVLENEHYRLELSPAGAITRLLVKAGNWDALGGPGNVVAQRRTTATCWEPYRPLDGGSRIAMKTQVVVPQPGKALLSSDQTTPAGAISRGPVVSEFTAAHPFGTKGTFATTVRLYAGLRRIDIRTKIVNQEQFTRYRALFPTSIRDGRSVHEIPFGAVERPAGIEFRPRTGSIAATAGGAWPCSTAVCPATWSPAAR